MVITKWAVKSKFSSKYLSKRKWGHVRSARLFAKESGAEGYAKNKGFLLGIDCEVVPIQTTSPDGPELPPNSLFGDTLSLTKLRQEYYNREGIDIGIITGQRTYGIMSWTCLDATSRLAKIHDSRKAKTFIISGQDVLETDDYIFPPVQRIFANFVYWVLTHYGVEYDGVQYAKIRKEVDWHKPESL